MTEIKPISDNQTDGLFDSFEFLSFHIVSNFGTALSQKKDLYP